jgi:hypothetical protein
VCDADNGRRGRWFANVQSGLVVRGEIKYGGCTTMNGEGWILLGNDRILSFSTGKRIRYVVIRSYVSRRAFLRTLKVRREQCSPARDNTVVAVEPWGSGSGSGTRSNRD